LGTGEILYFGGDEHSVAHHDSNHIDHTRLLDPTTNTITVLSSPTTDVFCSGHAFLADGRLLVGGGTEQWSGADPDHPHGLNFGGHRACWLYRPRARSWLRVRDMNFEPGRSTGGGRWYPTLVALSTGQVLAVSGHPSRTDTRHENNLPERYAALTDSWALLDATAADSAYYTRLFSLPDGNVFFATPVNGSNRIYNPSTGTFTGPAIAIPADSIYHEWDATAVMLPLLSTDGYKPRVLLAGGMQPVRINLADASPAWVNAGTRQGAAAGRVRRFGLAVLLPTGEVFIAGGVSTVSPEVGVLEGETYSPGIDWTTGTYTAAESWTSNDAAQVIRNYHSTALLLPNGRVWTAGSSHNANQGDPTDPTIAERRIEVYKPPYDGAAGRPTLTSAPASISYGETFQVESPQAGVIQRVALMRCGSVTHALDVDQRYVGVNFDPTGATTLSVTAPPNSGIAPPGYYMLWLIDNMGRPCQMAKFVRLASQQCYIITDRSTFSTFEVDALLSVGPAARFTNAFYVVMDGFLPHEVGVPPTPPTITFTRPDSTPAPGIAAEFYQTLYEDPAVPADTAQRITFAYTIRFDNNQAFAAIPGGVDSQTITLKATSGSHVCQAPITLTKNPNPYMRDGDVHWLSIDLCVFQIRQGMTRAGVTHGSGVTAPLTFIQQLLTAFDAAPADDTHPFLSISTDPQASQLELASAVNGQPAFNYAVAKVRYRAPAGSVSADNVRVFFRLFTTAVTGFEYNPAASYRRFGDGATAAPLLGMIGSEIASVPFFAEARVADMTAQTDASNRKTLNPAGAAEAHAYFGCWLDFNQTTPRFPLHPSGDGPFAGDLKSIQELIRGNHQCLIAEV
ncbi:MAG: galactose oxidase-like domain-containing protein, partial [bacterium]